MGSVLITKKAGEQTWGNLQVVGMSVVLIVEMGLLSVHGQTSSFMKLHALSLCHTKNHLVNSKRMLLWRISDTSELLSQETKPCYLTHHIQKVSFQHVIHIKKH